MGVTEHNMRFPTWITLHLMVYVERFWSHNTSSVKPEMVPEPAVGDAAGASRLISAH